MKHNKLIGYRKMFGLNQSDVAKVLNIGINTYSFKENGKTEVLLGGNQSAIEKVTALDDMVKEQANRLAEEGKTPLYFAKDDTLLGMIAVADTMKEDSAGAVSQMQKMGLRVVMLTGDNEKTANAIGREAGVDEVIAGVLPDGRSRDSKIERKRQGCHGGRWY